MPAFIPFLAAGARVAIPLVTKQLLKKNMYKYRGLLNKKKMYDTFMDVSEKVAGSKPVQTMTKTLEKVNPTIRKIAPDGAPVPNPMEYGVYKTVTRILRGRALKAGGEKIQAIKDGLEQGTMTESEANRLLKKINLKQNVLEKSKENPFM